MQILILNLKLNQKYLRYKNFIKIIFKDKNFFAKKIWIFSTLENNSTLAKKSKFFSKKFLIEFLINFLNLIFFLSFSIVF